MRTPIPPADQLWLWHHPPARGDADHCLGWQDPPLADRAEARQLAHALAERIQAAPGQAAPTVHSSDLDRARQAARLLARALGAPLELSRALRPASFGRWEGRSWAAIRAEEPEAYARYMRDWATTAIPGGESYAAVLARIERWWGGLDPEAPGPLIVVAHGDALRALAALVHGWTPEEAIAMHLAQGHLALIDRTGAQPAHWNVHPAGPMAR